VTNEDYMRSIDNTSHKIENVIPVRYLSFSSMTNVDSPRSQSNFLNDKILGQLRLLQTDAQKTAFSQAMFMSVKLDTTDSVPPRPRSPFLISAYCRFNTKQQKQLGIVIDKSDAIEFLNNFGLPIGSESSFKRKHSRISYETLFQRSAPATGGKNLVCTYAEWLHMESYNFEPQLPEELINFLPQNWELPDPNLPIGNPPVEV
jgi:hypothetical protein